MRVVATIAWDGHTQWSYVVTNHVLTLWCRQGEAEPKKLVAYNLELNQNFQEFLTFLLQKFHYTTKQKLSDVVRTIIIVMNQFTTVAINIDC
jgi:hypothetical protein